MSSRASTRVSVAFICPRLCEMGGTVSRPGTQDEGPSPEQDGGLLPSACLSPELQLLLPLSARFPEGQPSALSLNTASQQAPHNPDHSPHVAVAPAGNSTPSSLPHPMQMDGVISMGLKPPECTQNAT